MVIDFVVTMATLGLVDHSPVSSVVVCIGTLLGSKLEKIMVVVMVMVMNDTI